MPRQNRTRAMTTNFNEVGIPDEFRGRVLRNLPPNVTKDDLYVFPSGMVLANQQGNYIPVGCPDCIERTVQYSPLGYPTLSGKNCISAEEMGYSADVAPIEFYSNLWFCSNCRLPVTQLFPKFEGNPQAGE
jgi:hypothetical protein